MDGINGLCIFYDRNRQRLEGETICRSIVDKLAVTCVSEKSEPGAHEQARMVQVDTLKLLARGLSWGGYFNMKLGNVDRSRKLIQKCLSLLESIELAEQETRFEQAVAYLILPWVIKNTQISETKEMAAKAVELFRSLDEPWWVGLALQNLGDLAISGGEIKIFYEKSLALRQKHGDLRGTADSLVALGIQASFRWQFEKARPLFLEALDIYQELDDRHRMVDVYTSWGSQLVWEGKFVEARSLELEIQETFHDLGNNQSIAAFLYVALCFPDQYLGEYEAARNQAQFAIELFREVKYYQIAYWTAFAIDILGRVALAEGSYSEAQDWFHECLAVYKAYDLPENIGQALACLGFVTRGLNQTPRTQDHIYEALRVAIDGESYLSLTHTLPGIALLFADQGEVERAVELYALAATQGIVANSKWFDDIAGEAVARAAEGLPAEVVEAAKARGRGLDLWEAAEGLLAELEEMGWGNSNQS